MSGFGEVLTAERNLAEILVGLVEQEGALLPILHEVQRAFGHVSEAAIVQIAAALNLSRAEVSGVVSFYHDFRREPAQRPTIKLCGAEACQARGGEALAAEASAMANGRVTIETVYCLGLCAIGPAALVGGDVHARLDVTRLGPLIDRTAATL